MEITRITNVGNIQNKRRSDMTCYHKFCKCGRVLTLGQMQEHKCDCDWCRNKKTKEEIRNRLNMSILGSSIFKTEDIREHFVA